MPLSDDKQANIIYGFNTTSRYLGEILNNNNVYFDTMKIQNKPSELQLNKANASPRTNQPWRKRDLSPTLNLDIKS